MLLDEHLLQRHRRTGYVLREGLARLGGGCGDLDGKVRDPDIPFPENVRFFLSDGVTGDTVADPELRSGKTGLGFVECIAESSYSLRPVR